MNEAQRAQEIAEQDRRDARRKTWRLWLWIIAGGVAGAMLLNWALQDRRVGREYIAQRDAMYPADATLDSRSVAVNFGDRIRVKGIYVGENAPGKANADFAIAADLEHPDRPAFVIPFQDLMPTPSTARAARPPAPGGSSPTAPPKR